MAPKVTGASRFVRHPWLVAVGSGLVMFIWTVQVIRLKVPEAVLVGVATVVMQVFLWMPKIGPARRYAERILAEESTKAEAPDR